MKNKEIGKVYALGLSKHGALGTGNNYEDHHKFTEIKVIHPVREVACCNGCTYFLSVPPLFKVKLEHILQYECNKSSEIPFICEYLINKLLNKSCLTSEGIFRMTGSTATIQQLQNLFEFDCDFHLAEGQHTDDYSGLLKLFLRQLPDPLIPLSFQSAFFDILGSFLPFLFFPLFPLPFFPFFLASSTSSFHSYSANTSIPLSHSLFEIFFSNCFFVGSVVVQRIALFNF